MLFKASKAGFERMIFENKGDNNSFYQHLHTSRFTRIIAQVHIFTYMYICIVVHLPTYPMMTYSRGRRTVWCHIEARIAAQARLAADKLISYGLS